MRQSLKRHEPKKSPTVLIAQSIRAKPKQLIITDDGQTEGQASQPFGFNSIQALTRRPTISTVALVAA